MAAAILGNVNDCHPVVANAIVGPTTSN